MLIKIIGTSHIAKQSIKEISEAISQFQPQIVAVELDGDRAAVLLHGQKSKISLTEVLGIGVKGYLFAKIGQLVQQKLGRVVGVAPGADMKAALEIARDCQLQVALIDQPIRLTLKNFSKQLSWKERFRFVGDIFRGIVNPKKQWQQLGLQGFDLHQVPSKELIEKMIASLKSRYPSVYKSLLEDRNRYMTKELVKLVKKNPEKRILAVVGAGHKQGMEQQLNRFDWLQN